MELNEPLLKKVLILIFIKKAGLIMLYLERYIFFNLKQNYKKEK